MIISNIKNIYRYSWIIPLFLGIISCEKALTADEIIDNSIAFHDPEGQWSSLKASFSYDETRPSGPSRATSFSTDNAGKVYTVVRKVDSLDLHYSMIGDNCKLMINNQEEISEEMLTKHRMNCERAKVLCDYYLYLWGLPMKLKDPGTLVDENISLSQFNGMELWKIKVTYNPEVGSDTWYFYFDQETFELKGYQFYHDESKMDGEYITFSESYPLGSMILPNKRQWYLNNDSTFLGEDILVKATLFN